MSARRLPVPITFFVVVLATIFLIIFFGAWAASADTGDRDRTLSFGFANSGTSLDANLKSSEPAVSGAESADEGSEGDADNAWWQKAFLKACPLH